VAHAAGTEAAQVALMTALHDEHATVLWRYAMRLTGDASRAEDVVQETLLRAWHARDGGDAMTALQPIRTPNGPESQLVQGEWRETKDTLLPIRAAVGRVYLMMHSGDGLAS
jgi:hypothetical protein